MIEDVISGLYEKEATDIMKIQLVLAPPLTAHRHGELNERIAPPLGILYLASYLREHMKGVELSVVDGQMEGLDETIARINVFGPDILGISCHTLIANGAYEMARRIKRGHPETLVIMGGCHCTAVPEDVLNKSGADLVCVGEGERTMFEVSRAFSRGSRKIRETDFSQIDGLAYKRNNQVVYTNARQFIEDIDTIPFPARDLVDLKAYSGWYVTKRLPETRIISSRGCPFHCTFCSCAVWKSSRPATRFRSPKNVVDEIECLMSNYGIREFGDDCDEFNCNLKNASAICEEIKRRSLDITWRSQVRAHPLPDDFVRLLAESGCWQVHMGIESGDEETLRGIGKHVTLRQVEEGCRMLRRHNIEVVGMFMLYNVWEEDGVLRFEDTKKTEGTMRYALKLLDKGLINQFMWGPTNPYPGSKLFDIALRHGLIKEGLLDDWEAWRRDELYAMKLPGIDIVEQTRMRTRGQYLKFKHLLFSKGRFNIRDWRFFLEKGMRVVKDEIHARKKGRTGDVGKKNIVVSAINVVDSGTLAILTECLAYLSKELAGRYGIIALVNDRSRFRMDNVIFYDFPKSKGSWLNRLYYEYVVFNRLSSRINPFLWLSLHDVTPNVRASIRVVYCHHVSPFYRLTLRDLRLDSKFAIFHFFYNYLYRINMKNNDYVIVQQNRLRTIFKKEFGVDNIVVSYPKVSYGSHAREVRPERKDRFIFFYPSFPRVFKNFELICEAAKVLARTKSGKYDIYLTIGGKENTYTRYLYNKYRDVEGVRFIGLQPREKVFEYYAMVDCMIFPSKLESWGMPITEFKAFGKPMLLADLEYAHETIGNYDKAAFFTPDDFRQLAELMDRAIDGRLVFKKTRAHNPDPPFAHGWKELFDILLNDRVSQNSLFPNGQGKESRCSR